MANVINATSTGNGGLVSTGDDSGILNIQTNETTAITVDTSQNTTFAKSIILSGSTSGTTTLASTAVAGTSTATFPAATGTVMVSGNMPAFSAYRGTSSQSISNATFTKVQINTEEFDTASCFDSTTNFRFTPTTAGYYQVSGSVTYDPATSGKFFCTIYKNGTAYKGGTGVPFIATQFLGGAVSALVYLNGSTDYIELYTYQSSGGALTLYDSQSFTYFQAVMVRSA